MQPFAPPQRANQLGKIDRWLVNYFTFATLLFALCYVATTIRQNDYYTQAIVGFLVLILMLKAMSVPTVHSFYRERGMIFMGFML